MQNSATVTCLLGVSGSIQQTPVRHYDNRKRLGMQNSGPGRAGAPPSPQPRSCRNQGLKDAVNCTGPAADEHTIQRTKDVLQNLPEHLVAADMKQTQHVLVKNDSIPDTMYGALATVTVEFPPRVPRTQGAIIRQCLQTCFWYHKKVCVMCPARAQPVAVSTTPQQASMPLRVSRPCRQS